MTWHICYVLYWQEINHNSLNFELKGEKKMGQESSFLNLNIRLIPTTLLSWKHRYYDFIYMWLQFHLIVMNHDHACSYFWLWLNWALVYFPYISMVFPTLVKVQANWGPVRLWEHMCPLTLSFVNLSLTHIFFWKKKKGGAFF